MTYRGLGFGVPRSLKENVRIEFKNDEEGNQFTTIIWRDNYDVKENEDSVNGGIKDSNDGINIDLGGLNDLSVRQKADIVNYSKRCTNYYKIDSRHVRHSSTDHRKRDFRQTEIDVW